MSRSKISSQDLSSTDSEDDFQTKKNSTLERPLSALSGNLKRVDTILNETSDEDEKSTPVKSQTLKSGSTTSIASRIKNIFRPSSSKKKGDKKSLENKIKSATKSDTETEESRSIERSIKNVLKSQKSLEKTNEFERPSTRLDINNSSSTTTSATDRSLDSDRTEKDGVSDNDSSGKLKKAINSSLSSDSPGSSRSSIKHKDSIKKHSDSNTSSESDSDTELEQQALPIRVKIEKKPPIDKSKWKLEKPNSDSDISDKDSTQRDGDVKKSATISSKKERSRFLSKTFDLNSDNSGSSGNEMTDVSPLPTPKNSEPNKFSMNVFYKALESDNIRVDSYGNKMAKRINTVKKVTGPGPIQKSRSCDNDYEYKSNCHNSIDYESFGFKMSPLRGTRPTDISKTSFSKLLDQSLVNSPYTKAQRPFRVTSSALNRQREQQRIEKENQVNFFCFY